MDAVLVEAIGIAVAFGVAAYCSGAKGALAELEEIGLEPDSDESADDEATLSWWRERRRSVAMMLGIGHRLGVVSGVVFAVLIAGRYLVLGAEVVAGLIATLTLLAVALSDVIPVSVARSHPRRFALGALRLLRLPYLAFYPVTKLLLILRGAMTKVVGEREAESANTGTHRIWKRLVGADEELSTDRRRLIRSVVDFPTTMVREVMIPRTDIVVISREMNLDEILVTLLECGHSRIPVHGETVDDIEGLFYAKDVIQLMESGGEFDIDDFMRRPYFVPETKPISELLTEFQRERIHLAVVLDEFGGTAGLITLEDIIEEFFGDIQDEYDVEPAQLIELSESIVLADARIGIDEIEAFFEVELPENDEYDSLGGFLLDQAGNVPDVGEEIQWESLRFRIIEADVRRIDRVKIEKLTTEMDDPMEMVS